MSNKVVICGIDTSKLPKKTNKEITELLYEIKGGNPYARELCVFYNMRLVLSIVQRFQVKQEVVDDIFQVGTIGLLKAIDNFDLSIGVRFSTYAVPMIIGEIRRFMRDNNSVKVTRSLRDIAYKALQAREELGRNSVDEPTMEEISKKIEVPLSEVMFALDAISDPVSIFETIYSDGSDNLVLMDQIKDNKCTEDNWIEESLLTEAVRGLNPRERQILFLRYYSGKTQMEVSEEVGISQAQVSRLEKNALSNIKRLV